MIKRLMVVGFLVSCAVLPGVRAEEPQQAAAPVSPIRQLLDQFAIYFDYRSNVVAFKAYDR